MIENGHGHVSSDLTPKHNRTKTVTKKTLALVSRSGGVGYDAPQQKRILSVGEEGGTASNESEREAAPSVQGLGRHYKVCVSASRLLVVVGRK